MKVILFGASSSVGSQPADVLIEATHEVTILDISSLFYLRMAPNRWSKLSRYFKFRDEADRVPRRALQSRGRSGYGLEVVLPGGVVVRGRQAADVASLVRVQGTEG
jgi:hypothetical protein